MLQACPDLPVRPANTFELLAAAGADPGLERLGIGPGLADGAATFDAARRARLSWLEDAPIAATYVARCGGDVEPAVQRCGLPMAHQRSSATKES